RSRGAAQAVAGADEHGQDGGRRSTFALYAVVCVAVTALDTAGNESRFGRACTPLILAPHRQRRRQDGCVIVLRCTPCRTANPRIALRIATVGEPTINS